ncbi:hypothetical protein ADJ70_06560 [Olsenella sp. oral taxon 807]|uniref:DUF4013 domain-containing protein n=1 Tax=Olsenella sp. oral taxon 807 TaxID=712411 RepID=UPI000679F4AC|nr:DUF4013 domain-containing protein [Olsenella sp. oral taxon 807]AKT48677.1 hypothetical protein ADJ70_06560 [Olsenella sp. oral taxon 807]
MSEEGYLSDAWSLLVRGGGWPAVVLTLCVCALIPVVGWAFALGYAVEWARDIALGSDEPPRQRGIDAGRCLDEGVRTLAVALGWCAVPAVLLAIDAAVTGEPSFPHLLLAVLAARPDFILLPLLALLVVGPIALLLPILVASPCAVLVAASAVRSAVRRDVAAGRRVCGVTEMVGRDPGGYARVSATVTLLTLACATALVMLPWVADYLLARLAPGGGGVIGALSTLLYCLLAFASCSLLLLVSHAMVGLWVRQFAAPAGRGAEGPAPAQPREAALEAGGAGARDWAGGPPPSQDAGPAPGGPGPAGGAPPGPAAARPRAPRGRRRLMRRAVAVALSVCLLVVVLWPVLSMCATYLMGPSAAGADAAAARYGNGYSAGHSLGRHVYVRVGESDHAGWGREYYYEAEDDPSVRFKIVSAFYWVPAIENPQQPRLLFGADYDLDYWEPS